MNSAYTYYPMGSRVLVQTMGTNRWVRATVKKDHGPDRDKIVVTVDSCPDYLHNVTRDRIKFAPDVVQPNGYNPPVEARDYPAEAKKEMEDYFKTLSNEELVNIALNLYADTRRLREELDEANNVIR